MRWTVFCVLGLSLSLASRADAHEFAGGTGELNDPFQIATAEQLYAIGSDPNLQDLCFVLINDVDLASECLSEPVISSFGGTFDGQDFCIHNLTVRGIGVQGLFGRLRGEAAVCHVNLKNVNVVGTSSSGALVGINSGVVLNCSSTGSVCGTSMNIGGIVGSNSGVIVGCVSESDVLGPRNVGGIVGHSIGRVSACGAGGIILGSYSVGGIIGDNDGYVDSCYSSNEVIGDGDIGGLVGFNSRFISACYSTGDVTGRLNVGGLVGTDSGASWLPKILSCYSMASVNIVGTSPFSMKAGALVGAGSPFVGVEDGYFLDPSEGGGPDNEFGLPLSSLDMAQQASFVNWDFWGDDSDGRLEEWFMPGEGPPVLPWQVVPDVVGLPLDDAIGKLALAGLEKGQVSFDYHTKLPVGAVITVRPNDEKSGLLDLVACAENIYDWAVNPGDGSEQNPYQINTAGELESLGYHPEFWNRHFVLTDHLDMSGRTYRTALISPDEDELKEGFQGTAFTGDFNGQGFTITNLNMVSIDLARDYLGLFGSIGPEGYLHGFDLLGVDITVHPNSSIVGALVGSNTGVLAHISATGVILGQCTTSQTEGLMGINLGEAQDVNSEIAVIKRSCGGSR
ncbi:MAG: hypothetical protein K9N55_04630 [Phycisphaerae bacterium]|nr:hypothetical protein [Phycisphaerae bacterium]